MAPGTLRWKRLRVLTMAYRPRQRVAFLSLTKYVAARALVQIDGWVRGGKTLFRRPSVSPPSPSGRARAPFAKHLLRLARPLLLAEGQGRKERRGTKRRPRMENDLEIR